MITAKVTRTTLQMFDVHVPDSAKINGIDPVFCSACGKNMQNPRTGANTIGVSLNFRIDKEEDQVFVEHLMSPYKLDPLKIFNICYGCWLKSLGIKP